VSPESENQAQMAGSEGRRAWIGSIGLGSPKGSRGDDWGPRAYCGGLTQFSDDGQWWWDGNQWIATSQVVLPNLPMTEFERSGKLNEARIRMQKRHELRKPRWSFTVDGGVPMPSYGNAGVSLMFVQHRAFQEYRLWTLEQLAIATSFLLGPNEPMQAAETTMFTTYRDGMVIRDFAVVVTEFHVLVLRIDSLDGQPRWVSLASHPRDVRIELHSGWFGYGPTLRVSSRSGQWAIRGYQRVFRPEPVLQAWHHAAAANA